MNHVNHTGCSCPSCAPDKYRGEWNVTPYVAPALPMNTCGKCGTTYSQGTYHGCPTAGEKVLINPNSFNHTVTYGYLKDPRYLEMIKALASQYPAVPLAEIIKDLLAERGVT